MKKVNTQRFQEKKPEDISFSASSILENPLNKAKKSAVQKTEDKSDRPTERSVVRSDKNTKADNTMPQPTKENELVSGNIYNIEIPRKRIKTRHSFDVFKDQETALNKIQLAIMDSDQGKKPVLGDMIQKALDFYIKDISKKLKNVEIVYEQPTERSDDRSVVNK